MIEILYQDSDFVVVHKPAGLLVHRSFKSSDKVFLLQTLWNQIGQQVFPVHRLDRPTSGVIAFALNQEAARDLSEQIQNHQVKKTYWALVRGYTEESGRIDYAMSPEKGKDLLFHGAPAAIIVASKEEASCPSEDSLLATQNILLGAHSLGLGTCLVGFATVIHPSSHDPENRS